MATNPKPVTPARLAAIEARYEAATKGPWSAGVFTIVKDVFVSQNKKNGAQICEVSQGALWPHAPNITLKQAKANGLFIAHARKDVPDLVREVRRLLQVVWDAKEELSTCITRDPDVKQVRTDLEAALGDWMPGYIARAALDAGAGGDEAARREAGLDALTAEFEEAADAMVESGELVCEVRDGVKLYRIATPPEAPVEWRCPECGEYPVPDSRWRWCDGRPQHYHGYPTGHVPADRVATPPEAPT